ncbi:acyltransferase [Caulobacter segnis]|uniref:acyltransferase family protein n=1 Tax=Caulobacter segnis TaxID=88688 RepID=UPI00286604DD|nr:acyltransferase [Caulobacter segnis]MDR6627016.1 peptidoglycan/LPS O-acetylase OafA/YrhL [Caulobacter segnis]
MHAPLKDMETAPRSRDDGRNAPIGALRAFVTLLVVAHHTVLTYNPYAPPPKAFDAQPILWTVFPVVDPQKFAPFGLLTLVNDLFFMSLMFFISGVFVAGGLRAKGAGGFLKARALKLGVPFVLSAAFLAPLAYFPAWLQSGGAPSLQAFARAWVQLPFWPSGPAWFLWGRLVFGGIVASVHALFPGVADELGVLASGADRKPARFFWGLAAVSALAYLPLVMTTPFGHWTVIGPFAVQTARIGHYFVYFLAGIAVGAAGVGQGLTDPDGKLARRWWLWCLAPIPPIVATMVILGVAFSPNPPPRALLDLAGGVSFALACATLSFAALAVALRFVRRSGPVGGSLRANAYGLYLTHYVFTSWLAWLLLPQAWGGLVKGVIVFAGAVTLGWLTTMALRRMPLLGRIL